MHHSTLPLAMLGVQGAAAACTRAFLQEAAANYLKAIDLGQPSLLPLSSSATYGENDVTFPITSNASVFAAPIKVDFSRSLFDTTQCATFTELTSTQSSHPYVIHTQIFYDTSTASPSISKIQSVVADTGDWIFNATAYLEWTTYETWSAIAPALLDSRSTIKAAGDAYLDQWGNPSHPVPFATYCSRLEGGLYTGAKNLTSNSCPMGAFPSPLNITNRRYVIDEELGAIDIFNDFPFLEASYPLEKPTPSSNLFRVEKGGIRYIHENTVCATKNCGR
ncbi:hypothetical protein QBC37DRAFT_428864 [Rhypophila decipiens]|uniref:DUF8021 domain-containing protein n=1 Tax=Rhypophila decipiens TaxID=261697 RepID=A0AAN6Y6N1_9PEZI|nr:hypothetical protein QBC37DRAFT_428864 [Rhypophila decipiens]